MLLYASRGQWHGTARVFVVENMVLFSLLLALLLLLWPVFWVVMGAVVDEWESDTR
jgi:hypothetical protein